MRRVLASARPTWALGARFARRQHRAGLRAYCSANNDHALITPDRIRNIAIVAHIDHGKTTLVDALLRQASLVPGEDHGERAMDSNDLERERGITIFAKHTAFWWGNHRINIVDTPGHGDFGGEVERVMSMVDGVVLVVDVGEGPMAQTKYVLSKALQHGAKPLLVLNKLDREGVEQDRIDEVEGEVFDLFASLEATDRQLEYPTFYGSAKGGWLIDDLQQERGDRKRGVQPLLDGFVNHVPEPVTDVNAPACMAVTTVEADDYVGRILSGRLVNGTIKVGDMLHSLSPEGGVKEGPITVTKVFGREKLSRVPLTRGVGGDIIGIAGFSKSTVRDTLCDPSVATPVPSVALDPPVLSLHFAPNTSPLSGREGSLHTSTQIKDRLRREVEANVTLQLGEMAGESIEVKGRGEMQMGILIENMRREGFEMSISPPTILYQEDPETGRRLEPVEEVVVDVDESYTSLVIEKFSERQASLQDMRQTGAKARLVFLCPARSLIGFRDEFNSATRGTAVVHHTFHSYQPTSGSIDGSTRKGALIANGAGVTTAYALAALESRGTLFVKPGDPVYEGMLVGEHTRDNDLDVNPVRAKHLTNVRAAGKDDAVRLLPPRTFTLEQALSYLSGDEVLEVTPTALRLRKRLLTASQRKRNK